MILLIILFCFSVEAQTVQYNQEFQVNTSTWHYQWWPDICSLGDDGFIVCWEGYSSILGQMYDNSGNKRGDHFVVNSSGSGYCETPIVSEMLDGGFVVCWESYDPNTGDDSIFGQIFDNTGTKQGNEFVVNTYFNYTWSDPVVCGLPEGNFVVCWKTDEIFGQMYDKSVNKIGEEFRVNSYTDHTQKYPSISRLSNAGFVVCWTSDRQDGSGNGIFGQIYGRLGIKQGQEFQVNTYWKYKQEKPSVSRLSNGGFVVCWESDRQDGDQKGIFGQIFEVDGSKHGEEFQVNTYWVTAQERPSVSGLANGGFIVCWQSRDENESGIYAQLFDNDGTKRGIEFQINAYTIDDQDRPRASGLSNGNFVICWDSWGQDGSAYGIYGKYYLGEPILHLLQSFSLKIPVYDETLYSIPVKFQWQKASLIHMNFPWDIEYNLYIDESQDFTNPVIYSEIYDTTFVVADFEFGKTYFWKVLAKNINGDGLWSSETFGFFVSPDATQMTHDPIIHAQEFKLFSNYPNPFNPETTIRYSLPADQSSYQVIIKIYDVLGQLVITLRDEHQRPGLYQLTWNGRNAAGQAVPSGVYFCVLDAGSFKATQKMLLVR
jgi:hypothetical protein